MSENNSYTPIVNEMVNTDSIDNSKGVFLKSVTQDENVFCLTFEKDNKEVNRYYSKYNLPYIINFYERNHKIVDGKTLEQFRDYLLPSDIKYYKVKKGESFDLLNPDVDLSKLDEITEEEYLNDWTGKTICYGVGAADKVEAKFRRSQQK